MIDEDVAYGDISISEDDAGALSSMPRHFGIDETGSGHTGKLAEAQAELDQIEVEGQAGGGMVRVTLTARAR